MSVLEVEGIVSQFTREELAEFRFWFQAFDAERWDKEIEEDVAAGRLDFLIQETKEEIEHGRTIPL